MTILSFVRNWDGICTKKVVIRTITWVHQIWRLFIVSLLEVMFLLMSRSKVFFFRLLKSFRRKVFQINTQILIVVMRSLSLCYSTKVLLLVKPGLTVVIDRCVSFSARSPVRWTYYRTTRCTVISLCITRRG